MGRRRQHVLRVLEQPHFRVVERHLDDGPARRRRQHAVHVLDRRHVRHPERDDQFRRGDDGEARRRQARAAPVAHAAKQRGDARRRPAPTARSRPGRRTWPARAARRTSGAWSTERNTGPPPARTTPRTRARRGRRRGPRPRPRCTRRATQSPATPRMVATKPGKHDLVPPRQVLQHPGVRVRRARQVGAPVRRIAQRLVERSPEALLRCRSRYGRNAGATSATATMAPAISGDPERRAGPQPSHRRDDEHAVADHQNREDAVVAATERRGGHHRAERRAAAGRRPLDQPVKRQHGERQPGRHQQLDVRQVREHERTEREADGRDGRARADRVSGGEPGSRCRRRSAETRAARRNCARRTDCAWPSRREPRARRPRDWPRSTPACPCADRRCSRRRRGGDRRRAFGPPTPRSRSRTGRRRCPRGRRGPC